jgi:hypothetical protein
MHIAQRSLMGSFVILLMLGSVGPLIPSTKSLEMKKEIYGSR